MHEIRGKGAVGIAIGYYSLQGIVSIPLEPCDYNIVFDNGTFISKIKVISCSYKTRYGVYAASIRTSGGNQPNSKVKEFDQNSCDIVFVVTAELEMYEIESYKINTKRQISMNMFSDCRVYFDPS